MSSWSFACTFVAALACACAGAGRATQDRVHASAEHGADPRILGVFALAQPRIPIDVTDDWGVDLDGRLWIVVNGSSVHRYDLRAGTHVQILVDEATRPAWTRGERLARVHVLCDGGALLGAGSKSVALTVAADATFADGSCLPTSGVVEAGAQRVIWQPNRLRAFEASGRLLWNAWPPVERPRLDPLAVTRLDTGEWLVDEFGEQADDGLEPTLLFADRARSLDCRVWSAAGARGSSYQLRAGRSGRWDWRGGRVDPRTQQIALELVERASGREVVVRDLGAWDVPDPFLDAAIAMLEEGELDPDLAAPGVRAEDLAAYLECFQPDAVRRAATYDFLVSPDGRELWRIDRRHWCVVRYALPEPAHGGPGAGAVS